MGDPLEYEQDGMMPPAVTHTATCLVPLADENYQIYMFGGRTAAGASSDLWTFDVRNMEWDTTRRWSSTTRSQRRNTTRGW